MRGVNTIVATLVVVAITVAMAAVIYSYGRFRSAPSNTTEIASAVACSAGNYLIVKLTIIAGAEIPAGSVSFELVTSSGSVTPADVIFPGTSLSPGKNAVVVLFPVSNVPLGEKYVITMYVSGTQVASANVGNGQCR